MAAYIAWEEDKMHRDPNRTMRVFLFNVLLFLAIAAPARDRTRPLTAEPKPVSLRSLRKAGIATWTTPALPRRRETKRQPPTP